MKAHQKSLIVSALLLGSVVPAYAATLAADCSKKSLMSNLAKLDKTVPNIVNITGACTEDVVISGHADLTLNGAAGASLTSAGAAGTGTTLLISDRSKVTVQSLTINAGSQFGVTCTGRSSCVLRNTTVTGGANGVDAQDQSGLDIVGSSVIQNSQGAGVSAFGASTINVRPEPNDGTVLGPVISGHSFNVCDPSGCFDNGVGVVVQDGSFLRADATSITNNGVGVSAQRGAVIKIYSNFVAGAGVMNNHWDGINVRWGSVAAIGTVISGNSGAGIRVGSLSHLHDQGITFSGNVIQDVACTHVTAISQPTGYCGH